MADTTQALTGIVESLPVVTGDKNMKVVLDTDNIKLVVFAFDTETGLAEHTANRNVIVTCLDGKISFVVSGVEHILLPGDVIYMVPGEPHSTKALAPSHMSVAQIQL